jgi:hypothetical protein
VKFELPADIPPDLVRRVALEVVTDLPETEPTIPCKVESCGYGPDRGTAAYVAFFYPTRFAAAERGRMLFYRHLWYALYRSGVRLPPPLAGRHGSVFRKESFVSVLDRLKAVKGTSPAALADRVRSLPFCGGERIRVPAPFPGARYVVLRGSIRVKVPLGLEPSTDIARQAHAVWDSDFLTQIAEALVEQIGPVGDLLLKQAITEIDDPEQLFETLLTHIEDAEGRDRFQQMAPRYALWRLNPGFLFDPSTIDELGCVAQGTM